MHIRIQTYKKKNFAYLVKFRYFAPNVIDYRRYCF